MNRFEDANVKNSKSSLFKKILLLLVILLVFLLGITIFVNSQYMDDEKLLSEAITRDMIHSYSVDGFYPPDIEYMVEHYGLRINEDKYRVEYTVSGPNIMPTFKIIHLDK